MSERKRPEPRTIERRSLPRMLVVARRRYGLLIVLAPLLVVIAVDVATRGERLRAMPAKYFLSYAAAMVESGILWGSLLVATTARRGVGRWFFSFLFVFLFTLALGVQTYFHGQYATYLNLDATLFGTSMTESALGQLGQDLGHFGKRMAVPALAAIVSIIVARRVLKPSRRRVRVARFVAPVAVVAVFLLPCSYRSVQASTPDVIYFHALGGLAKAIQAGRTAESLRPGLRHPDPLPHLDATPPAQRNVVMILTESVRADMHCSEKVDDCPIAPRTNAAVPDRLPLLELRSNSSTTAIQLAVLWSGLEPTATRERLHAAPLLFEYAHAAGLESAYWTSHHMMFANSRLYVQDLPTRFQCGATDLDPLADIDLGAHDDMLVARVKKEMPELKEPFFAVVHIGNTHVPYRIDPADAPFSPWSASKDPSDNEAYKNYYKNAVYLQDRFVGDLLDFIKAQPFGERTVIFYTSDHGEAFREHGQLGHTGSFYDEEIHVPGWVDAPPATLTPEERQNLTERRKELAFSIDVTPTVLDLLGLWDEEAIAPNRAAMKGESWLRPKSSAEPVITLTNCSGVWGCAFKNWGLARGSLKLVGREWDTTWKCFDMLADPRDERDLGPEGCGDLPKVADQVFGGFPGAQ